MSKRFGYQPDRGTSSRDGIYPNEIAEQRPALATRVDCPGSYDERDPAHTVRGVEPPPPLSFYEESNQDETESAVEQFNRRLRDQPLRGERG